MKNASQTAVGAGVLAVGLLLGAGATQISSDAGYSGVGPNFLCWLVAVLLAGCGAWLVWEAQSGGFREMEEPSGAAQGDWRAFAWVSAGILANAALITTIGFILACALGFVLAVRGFMHAQGRLDLGVGAWLRDIAIGTAISAPVYWLFAKGLAIHLPGLTKTGWI